MTTFEMGLLLGTVSGIVIGLCIAVILVKLETRRPRRPGYVDLTSFSRDQAEPHLFTEQEFDTYNGFSTTMRWRS